MSNKSPNPTDEHVGSRVRMRRMMLGLSQEKLADGLGITFQQVQKYEKGKNRIGASRLQHISRLLQAPISFFFDGLPNPEPDLPLAANSFKDYPAEFLSTSDGLAIARTFPKIENPSMRRAIVQIIQTAAGKAA
jgi:transcriptional regulator with XRE-family HTH domain